MEVTISLPEQIFANLSSVASKSHRRIDEIIVEKIERDFSIDTEDLERQITFCSDKELLELAEIKMLTKQDSRLSNLLQKQNERHLTSSEQTEMWKLVDINRLTTLKKAFALREISHRGLNGKD
jgi:molybdopterin-guanine dinucleotide biosynthesis protein A